MHISDSQTNSSKTTAPRLHPSFFILHPLTHSFAIALLPFAIFWAETLGLRVFYHHDLQYYFFPYHKLVADIAAQGHLPLWNPYAFSGIPLLGDGQTAIFYPPNWVFFLLPAAWALTIAVLLQFSIAGVGMSLYGRALGLGRLAALVAALAFMFNGFLVARVVHLSIMAGAALIPLVFWSVERLLQRRSSGRFAIAALLIAFQALAGHPQIPIYTALALGVYVLVIAARRWRRDRVWRSFVPLLYLPGLYAVGYALAAVQLVPWIEFAQVSPRAAGASYGFVTYHSLRGRDWLLFLFPYGFGGLRETILQSLPANTLPVYMWERAAYVGLLPLALALVGVWDLRRRRDPERDPDAFRSAAQRDRQWALLAVLLAAALIAAGDSTPFGYAVYALPTIGKLRAYARAIVLASFAIVALAAFGVQRLRERRPKPDPAPLVAGWALLLVIEIVLLIANVLRDPMVIDTADRTLWAALRIDRGNAYMPLLLAIAITALLWWARRGWTRGSAAAAIAILLLDLGGFAITFNPTIAPDVFARTPDSVTFLRQQEPGRAASFITNDKLSPDVAQAQLAISWALPYGVEDINGFNSLQPRRYTDFLFGTDVEDVSYGLLREPALLAPGNRLLSMLNVQYALLQPDGDLQLPAIESTNDGFLGRGLEPRPYWTPVYRDRNVAIYRNPDPLPRAYFADQVVAIADPHAILTLIKQPQYDPRRQSFVESGLDQAAALAVSNDGPATARVDRRSPNELLIRTATDADRFLVLSEMWFPGWRATIDGQPTPIYRANYLFRGLIVPEGEHTIRMVYRPASANVGAGVTVTTGLGLVVAVALRRQRGRKERGDAETRRG